MASSQPIEIAVPKTQVAAGRTSGFFISADTSYGEIEGLADGKGEILFGQLIAQIPTFDLLPLKFDAETNYLIYVDDEGLVNNKPRNFLGEIVAEYLGFDMTCCCSGAGLCGSMVIVSRDDKGLNQAQVKELSDICRWFLVNNEPPYDEDFSRDPETGKEEGELSSSEDEEEEASSTREKRPAPETGGEEEVVETKKQKK
jgi:hypothetical protein